MRSIFVLVVLVSCLSAFAQTDSRQFTMEQASHLAALPLSCIAQEFPNKTSHLSEAKTDHVLLPHELHAAFYGCLDWHSSVHGHWMLLKLLKTFPNLPEKDRIMKTLAASFTEANMYAEAEYFNKYKTSNTYERTYGWAWLLKLDQELLSWSDPIGREWHSHLQPLTNKIVELWTNYLPKQTYPNRTGVHPNTAFGLVFALDWARATKNKSFEAAVIEKSRDFYLFNQKVPAHFEPDGSDFLSPSLEIADLMRRVLAPAAFIKWFDGFYEKEGIDRITTMPVVSDRTDMQIVHLDGLSLSRAWCMRGVAQALPKDHKYRKLFEETATKFLQATLPHVTSGNYGGDHWLASFAVYAIYQQ